MTKPEWLHDLLIVGVGSIGERHLRCFRATGRARLAFCEPLEERRKAVAERYGIDRVFPDLDAVPASSFDAAVVAVPAHLHVPVAQRLAEAGCHLLIEKPLSTGIDGIDRLRETVDAAGLVAVVAYVYRAHPALADMRAAIRSGRFGRPVQIVVTSGQHFPTYRPAYREIYYRDRATGGGAIQDAATHLLNAGEWLLGPITRLVADAMHQVLEGVEVEDTVHILARHGTVSGSYALNHYQAPNETTLTVVCERGTARFEVHHNRWRWLIEPDTPWHDEPLGVADRDALFIRQAHAFLDAIEGKAEPLCTLNEGLQSLRVNLAALAAADNPATLAPVSPET